MQFLCIGVNAYADDIIQHMTDELQKLNNREIKCLVDKVNSGDSTSIVCGINDEENCGEKSVQSYDLLRFHVSNALADHIIRRYEDKLITRIINSNYCYFNAVEKKEILNLALRIIKNDDKNFLNNLFKIRRYNTIVQKLLDYFENSNNLILDGFVNFRLKDYMRDLEDIVDRAVDEFLTNREYREFIRLLKYFVDIQDPKFDVIHVIVGCENRYQIFDENRKEITNDCIRDFSGDCAEGEINYDDLLVSTLITLAPRKIIIHSTVQFGNKELMETIKNVFTGKVAVCTGCELCMCYIIKSGKKNSTKQ